MTGEELLETYPKAAVAIKEFYYGKMIDSLQEDNDIPEEFKDMVKAQQFDSEYVATFIDTNPRFLFDIFDANNVFIQISIDIENNCFRWSFDGGRVESNDYASRKEAETIAVEEAFKILNDKL
jgi:hypothetical protein